MTNEIPPNDGFDPTDPIMAAWAEQNDEAMASVLPVDAAELAESTSAAHRKDQRRWFWLNVREVVPTPFIAAVFAMSAADAQRPAAVIVSAILVLGVGIYLLTTSLRQHRADRSWGSSVRAQLDRRLAQVQHRARMYRTILWWYFLPFLAAIALFWWGSPPPEDDAGSSLIFWAVIAVFSVVMYAINRRIGRGHEREADRLSGLLADFDLAQ